MLMKTYPTPSETTSMRVPKKVPRTLVFLALCTIGFPLWAQPGQTCSNPMNLGTLRDTVMTLTLSYPQTDLWLRFSTNQPRPFLGVGGTGAQQVKWQQANVYSTCAQNLTNLPPNPAPGRTGMSLTPTLTSPGTYLLHLKRFYTTIGAGADTGVTTFRLGMAQSLQANCPGPFVQSCGNLAQNGEMETFDANQANMYINLNPWPGLCQWQAALNGMQPFFFNSAFPNTSGFQLPIIQFNGLTYPNLNGNGNSGNPAIQGTSNGIIGIETGAGNSDIVRLPISNLNPNQLYFVSYDYTAGRQYASYHNMVDLDVSNSAAFSAYPSPLPVNNSNYNPTIKSGIADDIWRTSSRVFTATGSEQSIFIGNLPLAGYTDTANGNGTGDCQFVFIDNIILKPFTVQLQPLTVCSGQSVSIDVPCAYRYPGATYIWSHLVAGVPTVLQSSTTTTGLTYTPLSTEEITLTITLNAGTPNAVSTSASTTITVNPAITGSIAFNAPNGQWCFNANGQNVQYFISQGALNQLTLVAPSGAVSYQWLLNNSTVTGANGQSFAPGYLFIGSYAGGGTISVIMANSQGCTTRMDIRIGVVSNPCMLPCVELLGVNGFPGSSTNYVAGPHNQPNTNSNSATGAAYSGGSNKTIVVDGTFTILDGASVNWENCMIWMAPGAKIKVEGNLPISSGHLGMDLCQVNGCVQMWDRIENRGDLDVVESYFAHAEAAIEVTPKSKNNVVNCTFENNVIGIFSQPQPQSGMGTTNTNVVYALGSFNVIGNRFRSTGSVANLPFIDGYSLPPFGLAHSQYLPSVGAAAPAAQPDHYYVSAAGICLENVSNAFIGQPGSTNTNFFTNVWTGIRLKNCSAKVVNASFRNIEGNANHKDYRGCIWPTTSQAPSTSYFHSLYDYSSTGIAAIGGILRFSELTNNSLTNPTMLNCNRGLWLVDNSFSSIISNWCYIREVVTGITLASISNMTAAHADVQKFSIKGYGQCLEGKLLNDTYTIYCAYNQIFPTTNTAISQGESIGIQLVNTASFAATPINFLRDFRNNTIVGTNCRLGIELRDSKKNLVSENSITLNRTGAFNLSNAKGIWCLGGLQSPGSTVSSSAGNEIRDNLILINQTIESTGLWGENSIANTYTCNSIVGFQDALRISGYCQGSRIAYNQFTNYTRYGIYYFSTNNISTNNNAPFYPYAPRVGPQNNTGNQWFSPYGSYKAFFQKGKLNNSIISPDVAFSSNDFPILWPNAFKTPQNGNTPFHVNPGQANPFTNWFDPSFDSPRPATCNAPAWGGGDGNINRAALEEIATSEPSEGFFGESLDFSDRSLLFGLLKENPILLTSDPLLNEAYQSLDSTSMASLYAWQEEADLLYQKPTTLREDYDQKMNALRQTVFQNLASDSSSAVLEALMAQQEQEAKAAEDLVKADVEARRAALLAEIATYEPEALVEANLKEALTLVLQTKGEKGWENLENFETQLQALAGQCLSVGGKGVLMARHLLQVLHPNAVFNDPEPCTPHEGRTVQYIKHPSWQRGALAKSRKEVAEGLASENNQITLSPNPTKGNLTITSQEALSSYCIYNSLGQEVQAATLTPNHILLLTLEGLPAGVYVLRTTTTQGMFTQTRFVLAP